MPGQTRGETTVRDMTGHKGHDQGPDHVRVVVPDWPSPIPSISHPLSVTRSARGPDTTPRPPSLRELPPPTCTGYRDEDSDRSWTLRVGGVVGEGEESRARGVERDSGAGGRERGKMRRRGEGRLRRGVMGMGTGEREREGGRAGGRKRRRVRKSGERERERERERGIEGASERVRERLGGMRTFARP